jgi:hypothetical protein
MYKSHFLLAILIVIPFLFTRAQNREVTNASNYSDFSEIDEHVRNCPNELKSDVDKLIPFLEEVGHTDIEKARAIYIWLTDNISYDAKSINKNKYGDNSAEGVLKSKKAVCAGYANLYEFLGKKMGLEIFKVGGYSKNADDEQEWYFVNEEPGHAWNAIRIKGEWKIFDATWGAGNGDSDRRGKLVFTKKYKNNWFNLSPYEAIFTHYPEDTSFMFTNPKITLEEYEKFPNVSIIAFSSGLLNAEEAYLQSVNKPTVKYPVMYDMELDDFRVIQSPKTLRMKRRKKHIFEFTASNVSEIYLYENDDLKDTFKKENEGRNFTLEYMSKEKTKVDIVIKTLEGELYTLMEYEHY